MIGFGNFAALRYWQQIVLIFGLALACLLLVAPHALASPTFSFGTGFAGSGGLNFSVFACLGGKANGSLFGIIDQCPSELAPSNIFSFLTCNIERLATDLFGDLYCGVIRDLEPAIRAVLTLAIVFFGMGFTIGLIPATSRDFMTFLLKIVLVYVFATDSDYMIGLAYHFLVAGAQEGIAIVVTTLFEQHANPLAAHVVNGGNVFAYIDKALAALINLPSTGEGANVAFGQNPCKNAIFAVMAIMAVAFPPLFYLALLMLFKVVMVFFRAVFGYLFSLIGLAFLMFLSPIFLSFSLFRITRELFDKWLGYLASFSLQMIIIFAFMSFIFTLPVTNISSSIFAAVVYDNSTIETNEWRWPWQYCTLCDFEVRKVDPQTGAIGAVYAEDEAVSPAYSKLVCKHNPPCPLQPLTITSPNATGNPRSECAAPDGGGVANSERIQNNLLTFMMSGLLSLLILAYLVDQLLTYAPLIARSLASGMSGANNAPQIGGGYAPPGRMQVALPFEGGFKAAADAFQDRYTYSYNDKGQRTGVRSDNTISRGVEAFGAGMQGLLLGSQRDPGMVDGMANWLLNPTGDADYQPGSGGALPTFLRNIVAPATAGAATPKPKDDKTTADEAKAKADKADDKKDVPRNDDDKGEKLSEQMVAKLQSAIKSHSLKKGDSATQIILARYGAEDIAKLDPSRYEDLLKELEVKE